VERKNERNCKVATVDSTGTELGVGAAFVKCVVVVVIVTTPRNLFKALRIYLAIVLAEI